jgi:hypothetical protein
MKNPIKNHFKDKGYEFLNPGPRVAGMMGLESAPGLSQVEKPVLSKADKMNQIRDGIAEANGKPSNRIYEETQASIKKLSKALAVAFNSIPEEQHTLIIESYYSQNNYLKKKQPELFRLIQRLMALINEADENKFTNADNPDNAYREVKKEREIKKKRGTFKPRSR